ncbi:TIR3 [Candida theae]|uniref:TIR3 n=1 Tax=Candida theae TaxID=1198502 RepID=A0AAD5BFE2_9ASCO|nr:TIR3 [Candida theae]KAI5958935.1 TIR3 [Candida theae]
MKLSLTSLAPVAALISCAIAADQSDVQFLTALVGDYQDHKTDYIRFFGTANDVPGALSTLATQVLTYTDTSYTTLLDNNQLNIGQLESYASNIPWYTRIEAAAGGSGGNSGGSGGSSGSGGSGSSSESSGSGGSTSQSKGSTASETGSAPPNFSQPSVASTTSYDPQNSADSSKAAVAAAKSASREEAATQSGLAPGVAAPVGAVIGGLVIALL